MKPSKKQFKSVAIDILVLLANEDVTKNLSQEYISLLYRTIATDFALNFDGSNFGTYQLSRNYLKQFVH